MPAATNTHSSQLQQLRDFLISLSTTKGDLSSVTAPPFVLASKSSIEVPSAWASKHALFLQPASEPDPAKRSLLVAKNYICSLKALVGEGTDQEAKKPLNPFLGELFLAKFRGKTEASGTTFIAEQVSHHPPVTACAMHNREAGISSSGFVAQETTFGLQSGVKVTQHGHAIVRDHKHNESHLLSLPTLYIRGIFGGTPYIELRGPCYVSSSSGYVTRIDFGGKSRLGMGGNRNQVDAALEDVAQKNKVAMYRINGEWNGRLTVSDAAGKSLEAFDVNEIPDTPLSVAPMEKQSPWESRRAWAGVVDGIHQGSMNMVASHKEALEESQRQRRADEKKLGVEWPRLFFSHQDEDELTRKLLAQIPGEAKFDFRRTAGAWSFIGMEAAEERLKSMREGEP